MKIKYDFVVSDIAGENVAIIAGDSPRNMVVNLNATARILWELLSQDTDMAALTSALMEHYEDLDEVTARADAEEFVQALREKELLEE